MHVLKASNLCIDFYLNKLISLISNQRFRDLLHKGSFRADHIQSEIISDYQRRFSFDSAL